MGPTAPHRSASRYLFLISENKVSPQDAQQVLNAAFTAKDYVHCVKNLNERNIDPQAYIDGLDRVRSRPPILMKNTSTTIPYQIIDELPPGSEIYHRCLRALRKGVPLIFTPYVGRFGPGGDWRLYEETIRLRGLCGYVEGKG
jgi:hypothetical protein